MLERIQGLPTNRRWAKAEGPLNATIVTLLDVGWTPTSPTVWHDPDGHPWDLRPEYGKHRILKAIRNTITGELRAKAAAFRLGTGLEHGPILLTWSRHFKQLPN